MNMDLIQPVMDLLGWVFIVIMVCGGVVGAAVVFSSMFIKLVSWRL